MTVWIAHFMGADPSNRGWASAPDTLATTTVARTMDLVMAALGTGRSVRHPPGTETSDLGPMRADR
jgi:hypothetical protein